MKTYQIIKLSATWSTSALTTKVERILTQKSRDGYEIVSVSFGVNMYWMPTAFITICKQIAENEQSGWCEFVIRAIQMKDLKSFL